MALDKAFSTETIQQKKSPSISIAVRTTRFILLTIAIGDLLLLLYISLLSFGAAHGLVDLVDLAGVAYLIMGIPIILIASLILANAILSRLHRREEGWIADHPDTQPVKSWLFFGSIAIALFAAPSLYNALDALIPDWSSYLFILVILMLVIYPLMMSSPVLRLPRTVQLASQFLIGSLLVASLAVNVKAYFRPVNLPSYFPSTIPLPRGSQISLKETTSNQLFQSSNLSYADTIHFFKTALPQHGWRIIASWDYSANVTDNNGQPLKPGNEGGEPTKIIASNTVQTVRIEVYGSAGNVLEVDNYPCYHVIENEQCQQRP